ncbi:MAG: two-component sensor histidine kinase, partial [Ramlibacter sp.]|nr:two-component sensor histidine kinase [Cryobacterium sp.]
MTQTQFTPGRPFAPPGGELRLPTPPGVARRFWARHPWVSDSLIASAYFVPMAIVLLVDQLEPGGRPGPAGIFPAAAVVVLVTAALLFRRHAPLRVLGVACAGLLASYPAHGQGDTLPVLIALYSVAVYRDVRSAWFGLIAAVGVAGLGAFLSAGTAYTAWLTEASQYAVLLLAATLVGITIGDRKRYVAALVALAAQLARERDQQTQLARITERARIAREMHDIVAHSLSVMVALADGADALLVKDPERSRTAMREVAATGRGSMTEMRRLLGVLREEPSADAPSDAASDPEGAPLSPQPGAAQLVDLVDSFRSAGLPARLDLVGSIPGNPGAQLTIYRIVQESLTNALRYAAQPTDVPVRLPASAGGVEVDVVDDGRRPVPAPARGTGRGIIGLR